MPTQQTLLTFALVSAGIMAVPGPSNLFLLAHGIGHGRRAALAAVVGIGAASALRVLLTAAGLAALLASSAVASDVVRLVGAVYLAYLGVQALRARPPDEDPRTPAVADSVGKGLVVGLANPKVLIFYLAFFPRFIDPERGSETGQVLVLGAVFWVIGVVWDLAFACASGAIGRWLRRRPRAGKVQSHVEGLAYLGLAGWAAADQV